MRIRISKGVALLIAVLLAAPVSAQSPVTVTNSALYVRHDLDSTSAIACSYGILKPGGFESGAVGVSGGLARTSGSSTTTTSTNNAFANVVVGDVIWANISGKSVSRVVSAKASADSITVDSAWNLGTAGVSIQYQNQVCGANSGWFLVEGSDNFEITWEIGAMAVSSGGIGVRIEESSNPIDSITTAVNIWPGTSSTTAQCGSGTYSSGNCVYTSATNSAMRFTGAGVIKPRMVRLVFLLTGTDDADAAPEQINGFIQITRRR